MKFPERLKKPGYKFLAGVALLALVVTSPSWTRNLIRRMQFFHIRSIEIRGTRYLQPNDVVARLRVDTLRSLVDDVEPLEARLRTHPQIADVRISRRPPGTLVVTVRENLPVALVPRADGLAPYDSSGKQLPIDPARAPMDLPVLSVPDRTTLALLGALRAQRSPMYARISEIKREGPNDVIFVLTPALRVRARVGVAPDRLQDIFPVETDLTQRTERPLELDLRYRDQVIARVQ